MDISPANELRKGRSAMSRKYIVPGSRCRAYDFSFGHGVVRLWNNLPLAISGQDTLDTFKRALFAHLLNEESTRLGFRTNQ